LDTVKTPKSFDIIVAGGGLAGVLAAARLALAKPDAKIALLEMEPLLGGRLRSTASDRRIYSYGLNAVSDGLFELLRQTLHNDPEAPDLEALIPRRQARFGVLAGNRIVENAIDQWFTPKGARTLGGLTAQRQWGDVEEIVRKGAEAHTDEDDDQDEAEDEGDAEKAVAKTHAAKTHPFSHYWKKPRKVPAAVVLEHYGSAFGIPDVWGAASEAIAARAAFHAGRLHAGGFEAAIAALVERPWFKAAVTVVTGCRIADARFENDVWDVTAEDGDYQSQALVVAQPPWQAMGWLKRTYWPAHILQVASKTKPVSVVVLAEEILQPTLEIPDVILVPSERVQIVRNGEKEICFQATIDFELSLQAPAVVKAVKQLKRARRKLLALHPHFVTEKNHLALQPIAWAQSPLHADRRWLTRLATKPLASSTLAFCGDAYGSEYDGDANLVRSVTATVDALA
jgi:predicted NAD/FAD-dependent oxidoreductase